MLEKIDDMEAGKKLEDDVYYKLYVAEEILKKIPDSIPDNKSGFDYLELETLMETALFFLASIQDVILKEIAESLLKIYFRYPNNNQIKDRLKIIENDDSIDEEIRDKASNVKTILEKYFIKTKAYAKEISSAEREQLLDWTLSDQESIFNFIDGEKVKLSGTKLEEELVNENNLDNGKQYSFYWEWEDNIFKIIRMNRNIVTHHGKLMSMGYSGNKNPDGSFKKNTFVLIAREMDEISESDMYPGIRLDYEFEINNPHEFLEKGLNKTKEFVKEIRNIIPKTSP